MGGGGNHRHGREPGLALAGANPAGRLDAVDLGQRQIHQDEIVTDGRSAFNGRQAVLSQIDGIPR